jgi:hypothetical protein
VQQQVLCLAFNNNFSTCFNDFSSNGVKTMDWQNPIFAQLVISLNLFLAGLRLGVQIPIPPPHLNSALWRYFFILLKQ